VNAAALLGPAACESDIRKFRVSDKVNVTVTVTLANPYDAAIVFGGDGTVHRHLPKLKDLKIPLLVVPRGSGNDFAKALGIRNEAIALQAWREFCSTGRNVREIDLGVIRKDGKETLFVCVAGMGLDSVANARANRMPAWLRGSAGYLLAALKSLPAFQPLEIAVLAGEHEARGLAFFVAVANAHRYGGGMKVAPRASFEDGLLDVCRVGRMNKWKLLACLPTVFFGAHLRLKQVEYFQAPAVRVETGEPLEVYADGEYACSTPVDLCLSPRSLRVIAPH
jgi:diacylglycerol kinase (ATP)